MKKLFFLILIVGVTLFDCVGDSKPQVTERQSPNAAISGCVHGGYRHLDLTVTGEPLELTVYRGDYLKFDLNDGDDSRSEYQLLIPQLDLSTVLKDNSIEQPYFKMKQTGKYEFSIGERSGMLIVIELEQANYSELSPEQAWRMINNNPPFLLDVRTKREFNGGHIKGAALIPLQELQKRYPELEMYKNQPVLIYCATGNRSTTASKILLDHGYKDVMNLRMGIMGWGSQGYNIEF
ncbi:MAG: rhodanese-like domain-containing protein [Candidatus Marinimicrobia bacterium]|nr:rhodanese-like domain-containing protein [Candidatus Neomarinimicrobiota bacterium]